nr:hypothetical protein Itr_chr04CG14450 [Ipomoea trifida]GMD09613.1 hypothetical protein Iba_chr06dCG9870 [Ipomoea batatas]
MISETVPLQSTRKARKFITYRVSGWIAPSGGGLVESFCITAVVIGSREDVIPKNSLTDWGLKFRRLYPESLRFSVAIQRHQFTNRFRNSPQHAMIKQIKR